METPPYHLLVATNGDAGADLGSEHVVNQPFLLHVQVCHAIHRVLVKTDSKHVQLHKIRHASERPQNIVCINFWYHKLFEPLDQIGNPAMLCGLIRLVKI